MLGTVVSGVRCRVRRFVGPGSPGNHLLVHAGDEVARRLRRLADEWEGARYRLQGRHPDPGVDEHTLADRVRSMLGPLERRLDVPRVHVLGEGHTILLHGEVGRPADAAAIEAAVSRMPGVQAVESYLHAGLLPSDTRPSEGRAHAHSRGYDRLVQAARGAGVERRRAALVVRATLAALAESLPRQHRESLARRLPEDVRSLLVPPRRFGPIRSRAQGFDELVVGVSEAVDGWGTVAQRAAQAVLGELRMLAPAEAADLAVALPPEMRKLWTAAADGR